MKKNLTIAFVAAASLMTAAGFPNEVRVLKVDSGGGRCTLTTEARAARLTVVQTNDKGVPTCSWIVQSDSSGRASFPYTDKPNPKSLHVRTLDLPNLIAPSNMVEGEVVQVDLPRAADGEAVTIKTLEGEVVATKKADRLGRVILPTSLATGTYLLSSGSGPAGKISIAKAPTPPAEQPWIDGGEPMHIAADAPGAECGNLAGSPAIDIPVLAQSQHEVVLAPASDFGLKPGPESMLIKDKGNLPLTVVNVSLYQVSGVLSRKKLMAGEAARIEFCVEPSSLQGNLTAAILGGPVRFSNGSQSQAVNLLDGRGMAAIQSIPGQTGPFQLGWNFTPAGDPPPRGGGTEAQPPEPFKDPITGDEVTVQEAGPGYIRHLVKHKDGTSTVIERTDHGEFVKGDPLQTVKEVHTDGTTVTTTEVLKHKDTGEIISGTRKVIKKVGDKEETQSKEKWDSKAKKWVAG